jgi:hypothetical protein
MFKLRKNKNVFLDNSCFDSLLQFDSNPASTLVPANFASILSSLYRITVNGYFFSVRESACDSRAMLNITTLSKAIGVMASSSSWVNSFDHLVARASCAPALSGHAAAPPRRREA